MNILCYSNQIKRIDKIVMCYNCEHAAINEQFNGFGDYVKIRCGNKDNKIIAIISADNLNSRINTSDEYIVIEEMYSSRLYPGAVVDEILKLKDGWLYNKNNQRICKVDSIYGRRRVRKL